jgi:hypothetical protein
MLTEDRERLSQIPELTLAEARQRGFFQGVVQSVGPAELRGLAGGDLTVLAYYTGGAYDRDMTRGDFMRDGGHILTQRVVSRGDSVARILQDEELRDVALPVQIGPYDGAMIHSVPVGKGGLRPYLVWWDDDRGEWFLSSGARTAAAALDFARGIACGS